MTTVIEQHRENGYLVTWEIDKSGVYTVEICPHGKGSIFFGRPIRKMTYCYDEKKKAEATFRRYVKKYCKGE